MGGHKYRVRCRDCDTTGPEADRAGAARQLAAEAGWARSYPNGRGEAFRCPECRDPRTSGPGRTRIVPISALLTPEMYDRVRAYAYGADMSIADVIRAALEFYLPDDD